MKYCLKDPTNLPFQNVTNPKTKVNLIKYYWIAIFVNYTGQQFPDLGKDNGPYLSFSKVVCKFLSTRLQVSTGL